MSTIIDLARECGAVLTGTGADTGLVFEPRQLEDFATALQARRADQLPWRCFHCDEVFIDAAEASEHFGKNLISEAGCKIDLKKYREMEERQLRYCEEDTELHREIHRLNSRHRTALIEEEEKGYARGLADRIKYPPDGLAFVPIEPTSAMLNAGHRAVRDNSSIGNVIPGIKPCWQAMIKASEGAA